MAHAAGTRLGPYEITALLGVGGMGEVYRARDTRLGREVAVKVLPDGVASDPERRARFEREAKAVAALDHPHICGIYDVGEAGGTHYLVMPLLEGQTLAARLERGPLPIAEALKIAGEIADALDKAHRQGIVHRDLKPANVMLTKAGVKLLDFGLAKLRGTASAVALSSGLQTATTAAGTAEGTILGTIHYMAPEQVEGKDADHRADIWALGVVLYEMVTGVRPFPGDTAASVVGAILKDTPSPMSNRQPLAPRTLDFLVDRCLAKDADDRWQSVGDVGRQLRYLSTNSVCAASGAASTVPTRGRIGWFVAAGATLGMLGLGWTLWQRAPRLDTPPSRKVLALAPPDGIRITGSTALSPDGKAFVLVGQGADDPPSLWVRSIESGVTRQLPNTDDPSFPFWSPGADFIGFFADGMLKTVPAGGGPAKRVAAARSARGGSWGSDGTILFAPDTNSPVLRVPASGGEPQPVTKLNTAGGEIGHRWPTVVDAEHFLFTVQSARPEATGIFLASRPSGATFRLASDFSNTVFSDGWLLYVNDGSLVARTLDPLQGVPGEPVEVAESIAFVTGLGHGAFSASADLLSYPLGTESDVTSIVAWLDRAGRLLGRLGEGSDVINNQSFYQQVAPDGRMSAIATFRSATADIWLVDSTRGVSSRFTFDGGTEFSPVWSPDSSELLYASNRSGYYNIYRQSVSTPGDGRRITDAQAHHYPTDWSRDGRTIVLTRIDPRTQSDIWTISATDGTATPVLSTSFNEYAARLSPDGQWLTYTSDESGRAEVYLQRFPMGRDKVQLSTLGGSHSQWRADGREVFYVGADRKVYAVSLQGGPPFAAGTPTRLFDVLVDTSLGSMHATHMSVSADGQRFLLGVSAINQTSVAAVLNWRQSLREGQSFVAP